MDLVIVSRAFVKQEQLIVKDQIDHDCINKSVRPFKIHRSEVERIRLNRNTL